MSGTTTPPDPAFHDFLADGQPWENPEAAADQTYAMTPPSLMSGLGAEFTSSSPVAALGRATERGSQADSSWFDRSLYAAGMAGAGLPVQEQASPQISADAANQRFAPQGQKVFNAPISEGLARIIGQQKQDEIDRNSVIARFQNQHSWPVNFATSMATFMMDPLNAGSALLPGIGEDTILAGLGRAGLAESVATRMAARIGAGMTAGAVSMVPNAAIHYGLGTEQDSDYQMRDALRDVMMGAAGGALFHAIGGGLHEAGVMSPDPIMAGVEFDRLVGSAGPIARADAMRAAVSQMADGRPVDVTPVLDAAGPTPVPSKPPSLLSFLVGRGGIADEGGELEAMDARIGRPGLVSNNGMSLDYAREAAEEAGYLRPNSTTNDLLDSVQDELNGRKVYTPEEEAEAGQATSAVKSEVERERFESSLADVTAVAQQNGLMEGLAHGEATHAALLTMQGMEPRAALDHVIELGNRIIKGDPAALAQQQQELWKSGFAAGIPDDEFQATRQAMYGAKAGGEPAGEQQLPQPSQARSAVAGAPPGAAAPMDAEMAEAERVLAAMGDNLDPDIKAELDRTAAGIKDADERAAMMHEAALCLAGASA